MTDDRERTWAVGVMAFLLAAAALLSRCGEAHAQDLPAVPSVDLANVERLEAGQRAPSSGYLLRAELLEAFGQEVERLRFRLELTERTAAERCDVRLEIERARTTAAERSRELEGELWRARAEELAEELRSSRGREGAEWYESPPLWFAIGVVVTSAVAIAVAVAAGE